MSISDRLRRSGALLFTLFAMTLSPLSSATTILFVGNSFTYGAGAPPVQAFRPHTVTDLNGTKIGGVPALFKAMTERAGLHYDVSLETEGGAGLDFHYRERHGLIARPWDIVLLQGYSTLDQDKPGDPGKLIRYSGLLAKVFHQHNPQVDVRLTATWSRADQTWQSSGAWYGKPIGQMALDVRRGHDAALAASPLIAGVIPVGEAWNRAIAGGVAAANPYRGIPAGQVDLWGEDAYHGSVYGYYLEALTIFGSVTGRDPRALGADDPIARELGIDAGIAAALQAIAAEQLAFDARPEPVRRAA
ncbi:PEP-CTERM sorting domain-containing protein [Telluria beijingensis]|uniref:PEP-CTERM sorting domain-containing protein n=1 Tax=Telluria beijingensis TaxID=3068633 RepID=UPI00279577EB|nr:PEP-CTERM sorting domain-containing protein [Massilia sp. REN29]